MIFVLTNCLASWIVVGSPLRRRARRRRRARGRPCLRRDQRPHRHFRPPAADRHHDRDRRRLSSASRSRCARCPAATSTSPTRRRHDRPAFRRPAGQPRGARSRSCSSSGFLTAARRSGAPPTRSARRKRRPSCPACRSGRAKFVRLLARRPARRRSAACFSPSSPIRARPRPRNGGTYTLFSIAAVVLGGVSLFGGSGSAIGAIFGALMFRTIGDLLFVFNLDPLWQPLFQGVVLLARRLRSARRGCSRSATAWICSHEHLRAQPKLAVSALLQADRPAGRDRLRLHRRAAARRVSSIRAASCRRNICCSS